MGLRVQHDVHSSLLARGYGFLLANVEHAHGEPYIGTQIEMGFRSFGAIGRHQHEWIGSFPICERTRRFVLSAFETNLQLERPMS